MKNNISKLKSVKTIDVLGGMGGIASANLYNKIIAIAQEKYGAVQDSDYPPIVIYSLPLAEFNELGIVDIEKVKKIILAEIKKIKNFVEDPEPRVRFLEMADSSLNFKAFFYVNSFENRFDAIDDANTRIYNILNKNNIEIPFPQRDIHMKK